MHIHTNAMMLARQYIIHIDVYIIYIPKKYREAQRVLIDGRANGHLPPALSEKGEVGFHTLRHQTSSL
jgi:hypothetical protein